MKSVTRQRLHDAFNSRGAYSIEEHGMIFRSTTLFFRGREVGQLELWPDRETVLLSKILIEPEYRGRGHGRAAMEQLIETADSLGITLTLTPDDAFGGSVPRLKRFYKSLGFVENRGKKIDLTIGEGMYRLPSPSQRKP